MTPPQQEPMAVPYVQGPSQYAAQAGPAAVHQPLASPAPASGNPQPRRRRAPLIAAAVAGAVLLVALGAAGALALTGNLGSKTFTVSGTLALKGDGNYSASTTCTGKSGFADIAEGTSVTISDAAGATVAIGRLGHGVVQSPGCAFGFSVPDVPAGRGFYGIEVARRGVVKYAEAEISAPGLTLGLG